MARKMKITENEKYTLQDVKYVEENTVIFQESRTKPVIAGREREPQMSLIMAALYKKDWGECE